MVRLKAVHIITEEGFTIYNQSFGATEQDQDMVGSLIMALTSFGKEAMGESLSSLAFGREEEGFPWENTDKVEQLKERLLKWTNTT